jgi:AcrR family transcriptional regulator
MAQSVRSRAASAVSGASPVTSSGSSSPRRRAGAMELGAQIPSRGWLPRDQVAEIQRTRLLAGAVGAIEEHGYAGTTVAQITARSRISRRTFYELFANCEACLAALLQNLYVLLEDELAGAGLDGLVWRERVRGGLLAILAFFDREPALARVCVVEALHGGPLVLAQREAILTSLAAVLDQGRGESARAADCGPLTGEGLVGAAFGIIHARLLRRDPRPLTGLLGELMGMILLSYLGPAAARREQARPAPKTPPRSHRPRVFAGAERDPLQDIPMRVTYRTARVLQGIGEQPGVSNRGIADYAGIHDQGQISKLLARLQRLGLAENNGEGHSKGEPNAWQLTPLGEHVAQRFSVNTNHSDSTRPSGAHSGRPHGE